MLEFSKEVYTRTFVELWEVQTKLRKSYVKFTTTTKLKTDISTSGS